MNKLLALLLLLGVSGCISNNYNDSYAYQYSPPKLYISNKDCDEGVCVEITNYYLQCKENTLDYGYESCTVNIDYRKEGYEYRDNRYMIGNVDIVCRAIIDVFDYWNSISPGRRIVDKSNMESKSYSSNGRSIHNFSFDSFSETSRVYVTHLECGVNSLPPRPVTAEQRKLMEKILKQLESEGTTNLVQ
tara:strand:- start:104 stop:670 length:567 start_codon:yes stop_codon:yes gene_type:complete